jgi:type I restriction-modification system DNA methylase subunit
MINKESAYKKISELVERFDDQLDSYKNANYNETLTRRDFIDPFFKALGWDIDNEKGYAEAYREVIHEDKVKIGSATKAPDYSFRLVGGKRLFFVEAKKPSVAVKDDILPAYQVRRYGWSAKLSISIITDFEEFAIYDCTKKPIPTDKASVARIKFITYKEYLKEFDFIWDTFSKERVLKGSFDKFIQGTANKKGTATVDKEFLQSLDSWRTYLATSISWNNKDLDEDEINFAVQQTLDRLIFLRIAEDRSIEPYGNLKIALKQGDYYQNLFSIFKEADDKYNSGLFNFKNDKISKELKVDNKVIKTIINELYYPESPYEFSVLSVEILGSAYEQFLGKVIRITPAHHAKIEEKPEVRKAGGVYYTPQYIVEYIVKNTVGKLIDGKTPEEISKIKIVDPACGSGSFLIGAYQYLLDFHENYYSNKGKPSKGKKDNPLTPEGNLTTAEKKRILLNNIFGVDIDVNAVEVTKLSLLLKCMEGETSASIAHQLSMFHERVLPTLDDNIKDGNSLVDTDFYGNELFEQEKKIKPFNWRKAFPEVFSIKIQPSAELSPKEKLKKSLINIVEAEKELDDAMSDYIRTIEEPQVAFGLQGGFDVVIGNPPYGAEFSDEVKNYLLQKFRSQNYQLDSYLIFLEQSITRILGPFGKFGMIIPNPWLTNLFQKNARRFIFDNTTVDEIVHFKQSVFPKVTVDTEIVLLSKVKPSNNRIRITIVEKDKKLLHDTHKIIFHKQKEWIDLNGGVINIFIEDNEKKLFKKILFESNYLEKYFSINVGIKPYQVGKGKPLQTRKDVENRVFDSNKMENILFRKYLRGSDIHRYITNPLQERYLKFGEWLAEPRPSANFDAPIKIFIRQTGDSLIATIDKNQCLCLNNLHVLVPKEDLSFEVKYFLGIINSNLLNWYYQTLNPEKGETLAEVKKTNVAKLPIKTGYGKGETEIIKLVDQLLKLNEEKAETKLQTKTSQLESKIDYCENRINEIVYQLYGLTEEEIKIVEGK